MKQSVIVFLISVVIIGGGYFLYEHQQLEKQKVEMEQKKIEIEKSRQAEAEKSRQAEIKRKADASKAKKIRCAFNIGDAVYFQDTETRKVYGHIERSNSSCTKFKIEIDWVQHVLFSYAVDYGTWDGKRIVTGNNVWVPKSRIHRQ